jgi:adenosine deaminase
MNFYKLPKVMLNVAFESSVNYDEMKHLSSLSYEELEYVLFANDKDDRNSYTIKKAFAIDELQTSSKIKKAAYELAMNLKNDNVIYAEVVVSPSLHMREGLTCEEIINAVRNGFKQAECEGFNILIGTFKNETMDLNLEIISTYEKYKNSGVCGIAFVGESIAKRVPDLKELFDLLNEKEIPFSFECGKYDTEEDIRHLIKRDVNRIVGGLNSMIDFTVMAEAILKRILFVEQPKALIAKRELANYMDDSLRKMSDSGGLLTISIDSLTIENISLSEELNHLTEVQMYKPEEIITMNRNALIYSFLGVGQKTKYSIKMSKYETVESLSN